MLLAKLLRVEVMDLLRNISDRRSHKIIPKSEKISSLSLVIYQDGVYLSRVTLRSKSRDKIELGSMKVERISRETYEGCHSLVTSI
jgi:hypothetical protein